MAKLKIVFKQYGGKSTLSNWIISHFPEHKIYLEPFCGSGIVLFNKPPSFIEIVNDLDGKIINVMKQLRDNPKELAALLWATPYSNTNWRDVPASADDLEMARLEIARSFQYFCGDQNTSTWAIDKSGSPHKPKPKVWADWFLRVLPAAARLKDVQILQEDALKAIQRVYNNEEALIYADPVYLGHEKEYKYNVKYDKMVALLNEAKAKVVVSEYAAADDYFKNWHRVEKSVVSGGGTRAGQKAREKTEVLYMNFTPNVSLQEAA